METVYLKLEERIQSKNECIYLRDVAEIVCAEKGQKKRMEELIILRFHKDMDNRQIVGVLWVIQKIQERYPDANVHPMGPNDVVVEYTGGKRKAGFKEAGWFKNCKIILVSLVSFFGGAFTIMAFHNDVGITELFGKLYEMMLGEGAKGYGILEICYSLGLALGITLFFNHIGGRRITKDPTPIEVAMRMYEQDVNTTMAQTWNREGKSIDVS